MSLANKFAQDPQGKKFRDVQSDPRINFNAVCDFFADPQRQRRMTDSETHHDRAALAGVIKDFESHPEVRTFLMTHDAHTTIRFRQAVGVLVKIVMKELGWRTTGRKGSLGIRKPVKAGTTTPGAYRNNSGLSVWFTRAERYQNTDTSKA